MRLQVVSRLTNSVFYMRCSATPEFEGTWKWQCWLPAQHLHSAKSTKLSGLHISKAAGPAGCECVEHGCKRKDSQEFMSAAEGLLFLRSESFLWGAGVLPEPIQ